MTAAPLIASSESPMVLGLGSTGLSVVRYWQRRGQPFVVADTRAELSENAEIRDTIGEASSFWGDFDLSVLDGVTLLVASPGVAMDHPVLSAAKARGIRVCGDIDLFMQAVDKPVIGITGSNGKSTVTSMLETMIRSCGVKVVAGGNLGRPALDLLDEAVDVYVLELSSFQLERAEPLGLTAATVLNLSPDHLDRHDSLPRYHQAKQRIFRGAKAVAVNAEDPLTTPLMNLPERSVYWRPSEPDLNELGIARREGALWIFQGHQPLIRCDDLPLTGIHNWHNALAALSLGIAAGFPREGLIAGLKSTQGLPHRCELVAEHGGVRYIDDSKGTNVGATVAALEGLSHGQNIILIAGGQGKGQDFYALAQAAKASCRRVLTLGADARDIEHALADRVPVQRVESLDEAVEVAHTLARPGEIVLLSPACASLDMFSSYHERGERFAGAVRDIIDGGDR